jgi:hypothetical protein
MNFVSPGSPLLSQVTVDGDLDMLTNDVKMGVGSEIRFADVMLKQQDSLTLQIRDLADSSYKGLRTDILVSSSFIGISTPSKIATWNTDSSYMTIEARGNGVGLTEIAKMLSAADPTFDIKLGRLTGALQCNGQNLVGRAVQVGDYLIQSADTERTHGNTTPTKVKEIQVALAGVYRVKFDLKHDVATYEAIARIYKNGGAEGTQRSNSTTSYVNYSEDITLAAGDLLQLYAWVGAISNAYVRNFRIYCGDELINTVNTD